MKEKLGVGVGRGRANSLWFGECGSFIPDDSPCSLKKVEGFQAEEDVTSPQVWFGFWS